MFLCSSVRLSTFCGAKKEQNPPLLFCSNNNTHTQIRMVRNKPIPVLVLVFFILDARSFSFVLHSSSLNVYRERDRERAGLEIFSMSHLFYPTFCSPTRLTFKTRACFFSQRAGTIIHRPHDPQNHPSRDLFASGVV
jgi:hypothetical protein